MQNYSKVDPEVNEHIGNSEVYIIVLAVQDHSNEVVKTIEKLGGKIYEYLDSVNGFFVQINGSKINELAKSDCVLYIGYAGLEKPEEPENRFYVNVIKGLQSVINTKDTHNTKVVNLSIGPPKPKSFDERDPVNLATKIAYQKGLVIVVAAGNDGDCENALNPWSVPDWVISVGAASNNGESLCEFSSRGKRSDPHYKPTVVAPGIDIVGAWPSHLTKSPEQLERDKKFISEEVLDRYTVMSGTSQAASHVTHLIPWLIQFIENLHNDLNYTEVQEFNILPIPSFALAFLDSGIDPDHEAFKRSPLTMGLPLRVRTSEREAKIRKLLTFLRSNNIAYSLESSPDIVKKMLTNMAKPMEKFEQHEVGYGFVSQEVAKQYMEEFGINNFYKLFCGQTVIKNIEPLLQEFDRQIGTLTTKVEIEQIINTSDLSKRFVTPRVW